MNKRKQTTSEVSGYESNTPKQTDGSYNVGAVPGTSTRKPATLGRRCKRSLALSTASLASAPPDALVTLSGIGSPFIRPVMLTYSRVPVPREERPQVEEREEYPKLGVIIR